MGVDLSHITPLPVNPQKPKPDDPNYVPEIKVIHMKAPGEVPVSYDKVK